ncbi:MAG: hypothetical protein EBR49_12140 [Betaproteobacteria bacterium]|nr:hypothetical protein [Betaproteobacteria bacterium]
MGAKDSFYLQVRIHRSGEMQHDKFFLTNRSDSMAQAHCCLFIVFNGMWFSATYATDATFSAASATQLIGAVSW